MDAIRTQLLSELESELSMKIPIQTGAAALTINQNRFWIDFDDAKNYVCIHFLIDDELEGSDLSMGQLESLAYLNGKCEILGFGSVGVHERTKKLHYFSCIPLVLAHAEIVLHVISNIPVLKEDIRRELCIV